MTDASQACVYLYRSTGGAQIRYVGRGASPDRALQHTGGSHNEGLRTLIESGNYTLEVAGPYASTSEAALVEAALISALKRSGTQAALTNLAPGAGPSFRPLGVPGHLAERPLRDPLTVADVGRRTGGALLVRNAFGADLSDGRPRLDPLSQQQDDVIVDNVTHTWLLQRLAPAWEADPDSRPRALVGCAGPLAHRYVPGALHVDVGRLCEDPSTGVVPTTSKDLDAYDLRGRRITGARFDRGRFQHLIWVDGTGTVRYGQETGWAALEADASTTHPPAGG
ncbi:hypothetical protein [uncultured Pseudokineococcus sp.]|uniref:hypothetical protein n=1 Tax=uncultured Pseudokineococcus sp. TaxID=1642928 RepID=UPI002635C76D|nr:hypothetical protein [uncultured Pseudokineococcus sp.]